MGVSSPQWFFEESRGGVAVAVDSAISFGQQLPWCFNVIELVDCLVVIEREIRSRRRFTGVQCSEMEKIYPHHRIRSLPSDDEKDERKIHFVAFLEGDGRRPTMMTR